MKVIREAGRKEESGGYGRIGGCGILGTDGIYFPNAGQSVFLIKEKGKRGKGEKGKKRQEEKKRRGEKREEKAGMDHE